MKRLPGSPLTRLVAVAAGGLALALSGCQRAAPLDRVVAASTDHVLLMWKAETAGEFTRQEWQDFEAAVQEIKYGVMIRGEASGSAAVWTATLEHLDGETVRAVLESGLGQKLQRLRRERDQFSAYLVNNDQVRVRPDDDDSAAYLRTLREHQERRVDQLNEQIQATEEILRRRGIPETAFGATRRPTSAPF